MNKISFLFLLLLGAIALLGAYNALFPVPASTAFIRSFALSGFLLLCVSLMIGPLTILWPGVFAQVIEPRRAIGIACFVFVMLHILLLLFSRIGLDVLALLGLANPLFTVPATLLLLILTLTSSDYAIKKMGPGLWKNVQRFNYLAFLFVFGHFLLSANGLFIAVRGKTFINIAEAILLALGVLTVLLQIAGFMARKRKEAENKAKMAAAKDIPDTDV